MTFEEWLRIVANTLGLSEWTINVERGELDDAVYANINISYARFEATITVGDVFKAAALDEQRATIVHELLHCHFAPMGELVNDTLPTLLGKPTFHAFESGYELLAERAIEALALAIANMEAIPLPPRDE